MFVDISDKVIVVTGSSRGIGRSLVEAFAHENAKVVINYCHSEKAARELHQQIREYNENCIVVKADVTKREDVVRLYQETYERFGRVDACLLYTSLKKLRSAFWTETISVRRYRANTFRLAAK